MHCVSLTFLIFLHPTMDKQSNILVNLQACASVVDHKKSLWHLCADYKHIQVGKMPPLTLREKNIYPQTVLLEERNLLGLILKQQKELFLVSETEVIRNLNVHNKFLNGIGFACVAKQEVSVQLELIDNYAISR